MRLTYLLNLLIVGCVAGCGGSQPSASTSASVAIPAAGNLHVKTAGTHKLTAHAEGIGNVLYTIDVSSSHDDTNPVPLMLLLHYGYEGSRPAPHIGADMINAFRDSVTQLDGITIAPDVLRGDWKSANNEAAAIWLVKSAIKTYNIDTDHVIIAGFSMGGEGTWHIGGRHQDLFTAAIPIAAPVAGPSDWKVPVHAIHSEDDDIVSFAAAKQHVQSVGQKHRTRTSFNGLKGVSHYDMNGYASAVYQALRLATAK